MSDDKTKSSGTTATIDALAPARSPAPRASPAMHWQDRPNAFELFDAQDLALEQFDRLAGAGLDDEFGDDLATRHWAGSVLPSVLCAAAYS